MLTAGRVPGLSAPPARTRSECHLSHRRRRLVFCFFGAFQSKTWNFRKVCSRYKLAEHRRKSLAVSILSGYVTNGFLAVRTAAQRSRFSRAKEKLASTQVVQNDLGAASQPGTGKAQSTGFFSARVREQDDVIHLGARGEEEKLAAGCLHANTPTLTQQG